MGLMDSYYYLLLLYYTPYTAVHSRIMMSGSEITCCEHNRNLEPTHHNTSTVRGFYSKQIADHSAQRRA